MIWRVCFRTLVWRLSGTVTASKWSKTGAGHGFKSAKSCDLVVCVLCTFLYAPFLATSAQLQSQFQEKTRRKEGSRNSHCVEVDGFRRFSSDPGQSLSDPGERARLGRWHSPQVAPAAPPVPETNKNGGVAGTLLS